MRIEDALKTPLSVIFGVTGRNDHDPDGKKANEKATPHRLQCSSGMLPLAWELSDNSAVGVRPGMSRSRWLAMTQKIAIMTKCQQWVQHGHCALFTSS